jgi:hypothetical protein
MRAIVPAPQEGMVLVNVAEEQEEYETLPTLVPEEQRIGDPLPMITEWELDREELASLILGQPLRVTILNFGLPVQPIKIEVPGRRERMCDRCQHPATHVVQDYEVGYVQEREVLTPIAGLSRSGCRDHQVRSRVFRFVKEA